jgi:hypothetical protein
MKAAGNRADKGASFSKKKAERRSFGGVPGDFTKIKI